jgi:hypothetical protein
MYITRKPSFATDTISVHFEFPGPKLESLSGVCVDISEKSTKIASLMSHANVKVTYKDTVQ